MLKMFPSDTFSFVTQSVSQSVTIVTLFTLWLIIKEGSFSQKKIFFLICQLPDSYGQFTQK